MRKQEELKARAIKQFAAADADEDLEERFEAYCTATQFSLKPGFSHHQRAMFTAGEEPQTAKDTFFED